MSAKKTISREDWVKKCAEVKLTKADLNKLVMNYLVIEGYKEAAERFQQESGADPGIDLSTISDRMAIRAAIQRGEVEEGIERVNDLNPEILDTNPQLYFHLQQQKLIELIRKGNITEALLFAQEEMAPQGEENPQFLEELEKTMALLAFDEGALSRASGGGNSSSSNNSNNNSNNNNNNTNSGGLGALLDPAQRQRTASELNAAILDSLAQEKDPKLPILLKMLRWGQDELEARVNFPRINNLSTASYSDSSSS